MCILDGTALDESLTGHRLHCPKCGRHLTTLLLCPECGTRYVFFPQQLYDEMLEALEASEYILTFGNRKKICPICRRHKIDGHADNCKLGNAIRKAKGEDV
jgi:RNA polymerase subunit RPABC4/transcription elongation factor Spt4